MAILGIHHLGLAVSDLEATTGFLFGKARSINMMPLH